MQEKSKQQLLQEKAALETKKAKLLQVKENNAEAFTEQMQKTLDAIVGAIIDLDDEIELAEDKYVPEPGTEDRIHLKIVRGRRFNPSTGKEESLPYLQIFTFGEWQLFKQYMKQLGYSIIEVLHDPHNEAVLYLN